MQDSFQKAGGVLEQVGDEPAQVAAEARPVIQLVEPQGHRRAHAVFINGRMIIFDLELEDLVERFRVFQARGSWFARAWAWLSGRPQATLTLPVIDTVDDVVIQAPVVFTRRSADLLQSMGRSWIKAAPATGRSGGVEVVRGGRAYLEAMEKRDQRLRRNGRHG